MSDVRIVALGDSALSVQFEDRIDPAVNARAIACADALTHSSLPGLRDVVPAFRSVTVYFDPLATDVDRLGTMLHACGQSSGSAPERHPWAQSSGGPVPDHRTIDIPVCYDPAFGLDLDGVCAASGLSIDEVVALHTGTAYRVYMLGFVPGFAYLGSVDPRIATPRRAAPRTSVPCGSVGIAGSQTGIYPRQTAGGWNIIGRTPEAMVSLDAARPALLAAGDTVRFHAIVRAEFDRLTGQAS